MPSANLGRGMDRCLWESDHGQPLDFTGAAAPRGRFRRAHSLPQLPQIGQLRAQILRYKFNKVGVTLRAWHSLSIHRPRLAAIEKSMQSAIAYEP
jgi:hypothetical protein